MTESAFPRNRERFIKLRIAVQNERRQLCGMIEGGLTSPRYYLTLPPVPFAPVRLPRIPRDHRVGRFADGLLGSFLVLRLQCLFEVLNAH